MIPASFSLTSPPPDSIRKCGAKFTNIIEELKKEKKTILLTTHYIEEAERLCDHVAIVDHASHRPGTPRELKERSGAVTRITVRMPSRKPTARWAHLRA